MKWLFSILNLLIAATTPAATVNVVDSLQSAIEKANPGDTVLAQGPRVFHEHVVVNKPLSLVGSNSPIVDSDGSGSGVIIEADDVSVSGFVVRNSGADLANFDSAIMVRGLRANVSQCRTENKGFGVFLRGTTNCIVSGNIIVGTANTASATRGNGIHLWKTRDNTISGNFIREKRDGIYLSYADANLLASNNVAGCRFGIHYMYSHKNTLAANTLTNNVVGATVMFARNCVIEDNEVVANKRHGVLLKQCENSLIIRNFISGHNRGLFVQEAVGDRFEGNIIANNDIGLHLSNQSEQNVFVDNTFQKNTDQVWQPIEQLDNARFAANTFYEKGRGNFWSDYTGSDQNGDGIGDTPYHETDVFGYIIDRHPEARIFAQSPAVMLLRKSEEKLPIVGAEGIVDLYPLMNPPQPASREKNNSSRNQLLADQHNPSRADGEQIR